MFPLHNSEGKIVGFSGRIYKTTQTDSKYMNSPESQIFIKGETLYNYHLQLPVLLYHHLNIYES